MTAKKTAAKTTPARIESLLERAINAGFIVTVSAIEGSLAFHFAYNEAEDHGVEYADDGADPRFADGDLKEPFHLYFNSSEARGFEVGFKILEVEQFHEQCADNLASAQAGWDSLTPSQRGWLQVGDRPS